MSVAMDNSHHQRPRSKSAFSFKSDKSQPTIGKHERRESNNHKHKSHYDPTTKANPNAAMNEAQPIAAALEKPTLQSLRSFQHTDVNGSPIAEPDLSNPTRSRWERPLDTIRSFEAQIDNEYRRRATTVVRADSSMSGYASHRSSYYGGHDQNRYSQASAYHGNRQGGARDSWVDNNGYGNAMGGPVGPPRTRYNRMQSDPQWNRHGNGQNVYPTQAYRQSRDTVNSNGSNGSHSDPYSNNPSSENSSIERATPVTRPDLGEQYGFQGFGGDPNLDGYDFAPLGNGYFPAQPTGRGAPPPLPAKTGPPPPPAHSVPLNSSQASPATNGRPSVLSRNNTEKRKSWFRRRFSKD